MRKRYRKARGGVGTALVLPLLAGLGCSTRPPGPPADASGRRIDPEEALADFDSVWSRVLHTYYDSTFGGLDWVAVRDELRPRAAAARSRNGRREVIEEMLDRLGESHFGLLRAEILAPLGPVPEPAGAGPHGSDPEIAGGRAGGDVGLDLRLVDGRLLVRAVDAPPPGRGPVPGWSLESVDGSSLAPRLARLRELQGRERRSAGARLVSEVHDALRGPPGTLVHVTLQDASGALHSQTLRRRAEAGDPVRFGNLPPLYPELEWRRVPLGDSCAGLVRFNVWLPALNAAIEEALLQTRGCRGTILDLRGNPGGVAGMVMGTSGYFLDRRASLGTLSSRRGELRFTSNPRRAAMDGRPLEPLSTPLAILVDERSGSTSEIFAAGLQALGRARVFGDTTAGQALPAWMVELPSGDVLVHAFADFRAPDGSRIEGRGVVPDVPLPLRREDLLAGVDRPLEAALRWIDAERVVADARSGDAGSAGPGNDGRRP